MVYPGPETDPDATTDGRHIWENCSGYNYGDTYLSGFAHTHMSGTGAQSYGEVLIMPTLGEKTLGARSTFSHQNEQAEPGYYKVKLDSDNITEEMTCTKRAAIHKLTFPQSNKARILVDNTHIISGGNANGTGSCSAVNAHEITGYVDNGAWVPHRVYFYMYSSKAFSFAPVGTNGASGGYMDFPTQANEAVYLRVGISYVSSSNAKANIDAEIPSSDKATFNKIRRAARDEWKNLLGKIEVSGGTSDQQKEFYTALYHTCVQPQTVNDVNGQYKDLNGQVYTNTKNNHYSVLSLWDTFRAVHPLYSLIKQDVQLDVVRSMLDTYKNCGRLPIWPCATGETWSMNGSHADAVIAETVAKGITGFDQTLAWNALTHDGTTCDNVGEGQPRDTDYLARGWTKGPYRPEFNAYQGCSDTLEFAYDDWCISQVAKAFGKTNEYKTYFNKGFNYRNQYNPSTGFMQLRNPDGAWVYPFSPTALNGFTEGSSWVYTFHVLNDVQGLINLIGGDAAFDSRLDAYFSHPKQGLQLSEIQLKDASGTNRATGGTATAMGDNPPNETCDKAFDGDKDTKWYSGDGSGFIQYQFPSGNAYTITSYTLTSANDEPTRDPHSWQLQGSNDGTSWTTLDTRKNVSFLGRHETNSYSFANTTAFKFYRFQNITSPGSAWGRYEHDNEPSHHDIYLYNYCGKPSKTQSRVREAMAAFYKNSPDGLIRDDDVGQMSAWFVWSALGFYPVTPGANQYVFGCPLFTKATIHLSTGNDFTINATNNSSANKYVQRATLNGTNWNKSYLPYAQMNKASQGSLTFTMGQSPSSWASATDSRPYSQTK